MGEVMTALLDKLRGVLKSSLEIALWAVALLTLLQVLFGDSFVLLFGIDVLKTGAYLRIAVLSSSFASVWNGANATDHGNLVSGI